MGSRAAALRRVSDLALRWGDKVLASRCAIAQAICFDENGDDADRAIACLQKAEARIGFDPAFGRARAKIHWRRRDHAAALPLLTAAAEAGGQSAVERAHIAREAGVSTATLGDWPAAQRWFEQAQAAAASCGDIASFRAMAVGLLADAGHAACHAERPDVAILEMRDALSALPTLDQDGTIQEAHCHRVVRHAVLWLYREITGTTAADADEVLYAPAAASNPEPHRDIRSHPVVALDFSFYLLAEADGALPSPTGLQQDFRQYLVGGPILSSEISAAIGEDHRAILAHDADGFVARLRRHAAMGRLVDSGEARAAAGDLASPKRGTIPLAMLDMDANVETIRFAEDYLLSFAIGAAMARRFDTIDSLVEQCLAAPKLSALHPLLRRMDGELADLTSDRDGAANSIWLVREDLSVKPVLFCWAAVWLLFHINASRLRTGVADPLIAWLFAGTEHLVRRARFQLSSPTVTVPALEALLQRPERKLESAARLLLALAPAAGKTLTQQVRSALQAMAGEA